MCCGDLPPDDRWGRRLRGVRRGCAPKPQQCRARFYHAARSRPKRLPNSRVGLAVSSSGGSPSSGSVVQSSALSSQADLLCALEVITHHGQLRNELRAPQARQRSRGASSAVHMRYAREPPWPLLNVGSGYGRHRPRLSVSKVQWQGVIDDISATWSPTRHGV